MEKPDLFRTGVLVWLVLLSVGDIWQFNAIKKLSQVQTRRDSFHEHQEKYQYDDEKVERESHAADILNDDVEKEFHAKRHNTDAETHDHAVVEKNMIFRQNKKSLRKNHNVRESMNLHRLSVQKSKRKLTSDSFIGEDTNGKDAEQKNIIQNTTHNFSFLDFNTTCILLNEDEQIRRVSLNENNMMTEFFLDFKIRTDKSPKETSWSLSPQHDSTNMIIASLNDNATANLSTNSLYTFEYHCTLMTVKDLKNDMTEPICYDFYFNDSFGDGNCCHLGLGYFQLNFNNSTTPFIHDQIYSFESRTSFCIDSNGSLIKKQYLLDENESNTVCDSNPPLMVSKDDNMHGIKMNVMFQMMSLSGFEKLMNINTPQYKAACWILKDDPYFTQQNINNMISEQRIEERMIQRYILAVFYFATTGENWIDDFYFLSNRSECEWNNMDEFYSSDYDYYIGGSICDEDENVMSIVFVSNNLDGTIIEELYGLTKLGQLLLQQNEYLHGKIPPSLGWLPEVRDVSLFGNFLEGKIPPELFQAKTMTSLFLGRNNLSSSIPENIGNLKKLTYLGLFENQLTGSIPDSIYSMTNLIELDFEKNNFSSTISPSISNLKSLKHLWLSENYLTGKIPSSIRNLSQLERLYLHNNNFSGEIPSDLESLLNLDRISLHGNNLNTPVPDDLCYKDSLKISTDCRNDVFSPLVICSCCRFCTDLTPQWNGECADTTISIEIIHKEREVYYANSDGLEWSLIDQSTGQVILYDGPHEKYEYNNDKSFHQACTMNTGCYSLIVKSFPIQDTNYTISWNDELIHSGTFLGYEENDEVQWNDNKTMVTFQYDHEVEEFIFNDTTCNNVQLTCGNNDEVFFIEQNTIERLMYSSAVEISGMSQIQNTSSIQSKALCWILQHENNTYNNTDNDLLQTRFTQRYVLTMLHLMSFNGLFRPNEYPPLSDECDWEGIKCKNNNTNIVTTITLSSSKGQIIDGPLIDEIGSLAFVEVLRLNQTKLTGSIPLLLSNMWSLTELDLSSNSLSSSIPDSLFNELTHLKYLNLSNNKFSSSIPSNIGAYSEISILILSGNQFAGSVPLVNFKWQSLEHLDISENALNSIDLSLLLNHTKLNTINLATNFFVGEMKEDIFILLPKLQYFNVSQNEIGGVIPSSFPVDSNMTHLDIHDNRFEGTIPETLSDLRHLQYLDLQGNRLTGSIPSQLNNLTSLKLMALSNNELKGSISIDFDSLPDLDSLYLHINKLSGAAPAVTNKKMKEYTSDCGFPSDSFYPVDCPSCSICCNSENLCSRQSTSLLRPTVISVIFFLVLIGIMVIIYAVKRKLMKTESITKYFEGNVMFWKASSTIGDKSVYHFFLTPSTKGWFIGLFCAIAQLATLFIFIRAADIANEGSDLQYTMQCSANSLECEDEESKTTFGGLIFTLILSVWLLRDTIGSIKLFMLALWCKNIDFFFASMILFLVTSLSAWTSVYYNLAIAIKDTELIVNAVILLFVNELDERMFELCKMLNLSFTDEVEESLHRESYEEDQKLNVYRAANKIRKKMYTLHSSILSHLGFGQQEEIEAQEQDKNIPMSDYDISVDLKRESLHD